MFTYGILAVEVTYGAFLNKIKYAALSGMYEAKNETVAVPIFETATPRHATPCHATPRNVSSVE